LFASRLKITKWSRELAAGSNQIRGLVIGKARCVAMPARADARSDRARNHGQVSETEGGQRFAFTAVIKEAGAVVVRVLADTPALWPQEEYGYFETWTEAQSFASVLNQTFGIDPNEAQHVIISASLALRLSKQAC
jgi:hypothetical protein